MSNWIHDRPRKYLKQAKKLFGTPDFVANKPNGMALWKMSGNSLFAEHLLRDEDVSHCVPAKHHDFFYTSIKMYVPPSKLLDVLSLSGSVNYDGLKKLITARCGGIGANIATLYLASKIANGEYDIQYVKKKGLYASHIRGEEKSYDDMKKELGRMKRKNHKKYSRQLDLPRYALAFKKC